MFKVQGSKFKVQGSRFKVQGSKFKVQGSMLTHFILLNSKVLPQRARQAYHAAYGTKFKVVHL